MHVDARIARETREGRRVYKERHMVVPELPNVGWDTWKRARPGGLTAHAHPGRWEITYVAWGNIEWWVGSAVHRARQGECLVTHPGELHGGVDDVMHPCQLYWIKVVLPPEGPLPGMDPAHAAELADGFRCMRCRVFPCPSSVIDCFEALLSEHQEPRADSPLVIRAALHLLLARVLRAARETASPQPSDPMRRAMELLTSRLADPMLIETIAKEVGMGASAFHERFAAEVGATPMQYLTRRRVERAQQRLLEGASVSEIARELGLTREHFTTVFRNACGLAPGAWRTKRQRGDHEPGAIGRLGG
jgi:AraC family transcriptional regulator, L-rhamnose operon regulatory protein RhaS